MSDLPQEHQKTTTLLFKIKNRIVKASYSDTCLNILLKWQWGGNGIGLHEQGIIEPIKHAKIRHKNDKSGLGFKRKNKKRKKPKSKLKRTKIQKKKQTTK